MYYSKVDGPFFSFYVCSLHQWVLAALSMNESWSR